MPFVTNTPLINIVLDIDECIATAFDDDISKLDQQYPWVEIFKQNGLYIDAFKPHIIHPGVIELIQLIDKMPNTKLSFFSSTDKERNDILIEKLLCRALGKERYDAIKSQVVICSGGKGGDLVKGNDELNDVQLHNYGIDPGNYKKNLESILTRNGGELNWAVLIDDDITHCYYGQEKNILRITSAYEDCFDETYNAFKEREKLSWCKFLESNHIFYATGLLFTALEITEQEKEKTLSEALFSLQFKENIDRSKNCKMTFNHDLFKNMDYYERGLKKLKEINPNLYFLSSENYLNRAKFENVPTKKLVQNMIANSGLYESIPVTISELIQNTKDEQFKII